MSKICTEGHGQTTSPVGPVGEIVHDDDVCYYNGERLRPRGGNEESMRLCLQKSADSKPVLVCGHLCVAYMYRAQLVRLGGSRLGLASLIKFHAIPCTR